MEKRAILAAVLMAGLLIAYQFLFVAPTPPPAAEKPKSEVGAGDGTPGSSSPAATPPGTALSPPPAQEAQRVPERTTVVETPLYKAVFGSDGGEMKGWELNYRGRKPLVLDRIAGFRGIEVGRPGTPTRRVAFAMAPDGLKLGKELPEGSLTLNGEDGFGMAVGSVLRFRADNYSIEQELTVENRNNVAQTAVVVLPWVAPVEWPKEQGEKFLGQHPIRVARSTGTAVVREDIHKLGERTGDGRWIALESDWYVTAMIPERGGWQLRERKGTEGQPQGAPFVEIALQASLPVLAPGQSWHGAVTYYVGPKDYERLKSVGAGLEKAIYFGGFPVPQAYGGLPMEWLAVPIMWVMNLFYKFTGNYGVAIIMLTVITKVLFFPLTIKSMTSMRAMQALQPQINALRSKYKNDAQRLQRETMELYRANRVNPLGGCLPMVVQIPIFYALYVALSVSVEMQNAPFICFGRMPTWMPGVGGQDLWICDLAMPDPTYVLPLLMGVSMFIQQKMQPVMGDPRQAKMMLFMPVLFTFMFLNLQSGLVLYWTLSNVFQIAQQKYMERGARGPKLSPRALKKA